MTLLFIKVLLVPLLIAAVTWANGKLGPRIAGTIAALPIVAGPAALAVSLEQGPAFGARAAVGTLAGELSLGVFCVVYMRVCRTRGWGLSLLAGYAGFLASSLLLAELELGLGVALALALLTPSLIARLAPQPGEPALPRPVSRLELGLRMFAGAALVTAITAAARTLGTTWSGLLTIFPIATSVLAVSSQRSGGPAQTLHLLRGLGAGLYGLTAFFATLALQVDRASLAWAYGTAVVAALVAQLLVLALLTRDRHRVQKASSSALTSSSP